VKIFSIKSIPKNISISSHEEATNLLKKSGGTVAVWGFIDRQKSDKYTTTGFSTISFTFVHSPVIVHPLRRKAIAYSLLGKKFQYKEKTKILDRRIMTQDIGIVVCNLIGTALLFDRKFDDAIKVFSPLYASLESILDKKDTPNYLVSFIKQIGFDLAYSLTHSSEVLYMKYLLQNKLFEIPENLLRNWISAIEQAICLDKQNSTHYLVKGIFHFLLGEIGEAINSEYRAKKFAPKALATPNFSLAFLYNFKGNFEKSRREYRLGMAKKTSYDKELIDQCLLFIKQTIDYFPEKKQLHLALGLIEIHRGSLENGKEILTNFLNNPPQEHNLRPFVKQAKELLKSVAEKTEKDQQYNN
jgi:hypothetical protein